MADLITGHTVHFVRSTAVPAEIPVRLVKAAEAKSLRAVQVLDGWIEAPIGDGAWTAAGRLSFQNGAWVMSELRIFPTEATTGSRQLGSWTGALLGIRARAPAGGITARQLRRAPVGALRRKGELMMAALQASQGGFPFGDEFATPRITAQFAKLNPADVPTKRPRGRRPLPDEVFAELARDYTEELAKGPAPIKAVAKKHGMTIAAARSGIHTARVRGLLTRSDKGRAGGLLTSRAKELLRDRNSSARIRQRKR